MVFQTLLFPVYLFLSFLGQQEEVFFKSGLLHEIELTRMMGEFSILDDSGELTEIQAMKDEEGILYWHRRVFTPVCLTGECFMVDVSIYWYCTGEFFGLEVYKEHLTKTDHSVFSQQDYDKLISVLSNDWSSLREYEFSDLVDEVEEGVDGTSGATKKEIADEAVEDAVYTTYTLWHLIHVGEKEQLSQLTANILEVDDLIRHLVETKERRYQHFLLDLFITGRINYSEILSSLLVEGLTSEGDPFFKSLAIKALSKADLNDSLIQREVTKIYPKASIDEKLQILTALNGFWSMDKNLYNALAADLEMGNEWFLIKLLNVLKSVPHPTAKVVAAAQKLLESSNPMVKKAAEEFLSYKNI